MIVITSETKLLDLELDCLVSYIFEDDINTSIEFLNLDDELQQYIKGLVDDGEINGRFGQLNLVHTHNKAKQKRITSILVSR